MDPDNNHFDIIIIGGGSAGYAAARTAAEYSKSVAIVDGSPVLGGLCILKGCMPSKTLLYAADVLHQARKGKRVGLNLVGGHLNMHALQERKRRLVDEFAAHRMSQLSSEKFTLFRSRARFIDHLTIALDDGRELWSDKYVLATGSVVNKPDVPGMAEVPVMTSDDVLNLDVVPESVIVLGGGIVACELAQFLNRAGARVTIIQRSPFLLKSLSPEASSLVEKALSDEGISVMTDTHIEGIEKMDGEIFVQYRQGNQTRVASASHLMNALGRVPNTEGLDLQNADVRLAPGGHVETNLYQQTSNPMIYAAGDVAGPHEIVHVAILQGECAARHALKGVETPVDYDNLLRVVFTDPQVAHVGLTRDELREREIDFVEARYPFFDHGKAMLMDAVYGFVRVLVRRDNGVIMGAECVGRDASELIHVMSVAVATGQTVASMLKAHWYHPTLSEIWTYPLEEVQSSLR